MSKNLPKEPRQLDELYLLNPLNELLEVITHLLRNSLNVSFANLTDLKENTKIEDLPLIEDSLNSLGRVIELVKSLESFLELKIIEGSDCDKIAYFLKRFLKLLIKKIILK